MQGDSIVADHPVLILTQLLQAGPVIHCMIRTMSTIGFYASKVISSKIANHSHIAPNHLLVVQLEDTITFSYH